MFLKIFRWGRIQPQLSTQRPQIIVNNGETYFVSVIIARKVHNIKKRGYYILDIFSLTLFCSGLQKGSCHTTKLSI